MVEEEKLTIECMSCGSHKTVLASSWENGDQFKCHCKSSRFILYKTTYTHAKPEPPPVPNSLPCIQDLVIADLHQRKQDGIAKYGTHLQPFNGRNSLKDAYQEALDLCQYLKQKLIEEEIDSSAKVPL